METAFGIAGLITAAAITPGPNNLAILQIAARRGLAGSGPAIAGVVTGGLAMLAIGYLGLGAWLAASPRAGLGLAALGSLYLGWLAVLLLFPRTTQGTGDAGHPRPPAPMGPAALFAFQFVNPKGWVLVLTATSIAQASPAAPGFAVLAAMFLFIPALCLSLWSLFGAATAVLWSSEAARRRVDRAMGLLLAASVCLLWR